MKEFRVLKASTIARQIEGLVCQDSTVGRAEKR